MAISDIWRHREMVFSLPFFFILIYVWWLESLDLVETTLDISCRSVMERFHGCARCLFITEVHVQIANLSTDDGLGGQLVDSRIIANNRITDNFHNLIIIPEHEHSELAEITTELINQFSINSIYCSGASYLAHIQLSRTDDFLQLKCNLTAREWREKIFIKF